MNDIRGREIRRGHYVAYPDGATYRVGIVKNFGKETVHITGIMKERWMADDIFEKRKKSFLCVILDSVELEAHICNIFLSQHPSGARTKLNMANDPKQDAYFEIRVDDFVESRLKMLLHLRHMLASPPAVPDATDAQMEILECLLKKNGKVSITTIY